MDHDLNREESLINPLNGSVIGPRTASVRTETGSTRNSRYPFKRYPVGARPTFDVSNNVIIHKERTAVSGDGSGGESLLKCKKFAVKGSKIEKTEAAVSKGRSCIFSILISVVICCFLAEAMLQGSIMMLLKQTDLSSPIDKITLQISGIKDVREKYFMEYEVRFLPWKFVQRFSNEKDKAILKDLHMLKQISIRPPLLALVCWNLERNAEFLYLITIFKGIQELGYKLELYAFNKGPMYELWINAGAVVNFIHLDELHKVAVDWSKFEGVVVSSLNCRAAIVSLMQEPFKGVPVIWIIPEDTLGNRLRLYESTGMMDLILNWRRIFDRADVTVFPDYSLPMLYSILDTGNQIVIPGVPSDVWEAQQYMALHKREHIRASYGLQHKDSVIAIVGNAFAYKGVWREHAFIMKAILPVAQNLMNMDRASDISLKLIFIYGKSSTDYLIMLQKIALHLGLASEMILHFGVEGDMNGLLWSSDAVIYCSLRNEQSFPKIISRSMAFGLPIVAPNNTAIKMHIVDGVNGMLFSPGNVTDLTATFLKIFSNRGISTLAHKIAFEASSHAHSILAEDAVVGYAKLLESVLQFSSETMLPLPISNLSDAVKRDWQWQLLATSDGIPHLDSSLEDPTHANNVVYELEMQFNRTKPDGLEPSKTHQYDDYELLDLTVWEDAKAIQISEDIENREEEELEERLERLQSSWEDVSRGVKRAEKGMHELHERDDGELLRTGQPLCVYEPYDGAGAWPFLHDKNALYRGISMSPGQRRWGMDDIEALSRLPLLNDTYYVNAICEYAAFFAIANHIDRIHKNAWIGFQPWQAAGRKVALSTEAEKVLVDAARTERNGDAIFFWARMQGDRGEISLNANKYRDFWSFCDAINNGQCRRVFLEAFKQMYGLPSTWTQLPPMPSETGMWAVFDCWVMPTSSFLELVMFARMFVNALDSQLYFEHHEQGKCCLGFSDSEVQHCYCRILELLVNVWAYQSARRMIYIDPNTGSMYEQHKLDGRQQIWLRFFNYTTLAEMDDDLAEEADDERLKNSGRRWLWPHTGEVFSPEISDREKRENYYLRMVMKKKNRDRIERIRNRYKQKPLAGG